jgi:hypothetical protein
VSKRWTGVAALAVSLSVVWLVFIILGSPWMGLMWVVSLAFTASLWANLRAPESVPVVAPTPIAAPAPKAVL